MEQHESKSDLESFHEFLKDYITKSRYWVLQYCTFTLLIGILIGTFIGAAIIQREKLDNKALYRDVGTVHAYGQDYYELPRKGNLK